MPTKADIAPMLVSLVRGFLLAFLGAVTIAGGFDEVSWTAAAWAGFLAAANVLVGYLGTFDIRYGRGSTQDA